MLSLVISLCPNWSDLMWSEPMNVSIPFCRFHGILPTNCENFQILYFSQLLQETSHRFLGFYFYSYSSVILIETASEPSPYLSQSWRFWMWASIYYDSWLSIQQPMDDLTKMFFLSMNSCIFDLIPCEPRKLNSFNCCIM